MEFSFREGLIMLSLAVSPTLGLSIALIIQRIAS
jgi:hypothetical protein